MAHPHQGQPTDPLDALPNGVGEQNVIEDTPPDPTAGDHNEDILPSIVPMEPEDRQPVIRPAPNVPGPRLSTRVRRPTMHYGDPAEIPETIQDEELTDLFG